MASQIWEVTGGADKGGILVRSGQDTASAEESIRLSTGALVRELALKGVRLNYELLEGSGPERGWVSVQIKGKDLLVKTDKKPSGGGSCCPPDSWPACQAPADYTPRGAEQLIGDLPVYSVMPEKATDKACVVLPDIFGWSQNMGRLKGICDTLADNGFLVIMPDPFRGDTATGKPMMSWIASFKWETVGVDVQACVKWLGENGAVDIGAVGFCWGAWAMCRAASEGAPFKCGVGPHPSLGIEMAHGGNERKMVEGVKMPVLLMPAGGDPSNVKTGGELAMLLSRHGGTTKTFTKMQHGWVSRGDLRIPAVKQDTEEAMKLMVDFLKEHM